MKICYASDDDVYTNLFALSPHTAPASDVPYA
jgi:hypothetical protein